MAGNTKAQEGFVSSLDTKGALNPGSGFNRSFGAGESNDAYKARLLAWQGQQGAGSTSGGAMAGLNGAGPGGGGSVGGLTPPGAGDSPAPMTSLGGGEAEVSSLGGEGSIRGNLGHRLYPQQSAALAGLRRVY